MAEEQIVKHIQVGPCYRVKFEQSAVKGILGYTVEVQAYSAKEAMKEARKLLKEAQETANPLPEPQLAVPNLDREATVIK